MEKSIKINQDKVIVQKKIDEGGQSEVYSALLDEKEVIIKSYKKLTKQDIEEVKVYQLLEHEIMVKFYGCYKDQEGKYNIVLEKALGDKLDILILMEKDYYCLNPNSEQYEKIKEKILTYKEKLFIVLQLCGFLIYLKKNNVIHRDLKPSNIMVDKSNNTKVKIFDFGISRISSRTFTFTHSLDKYTVNYSSPEQYLIDDDKTLVTPKIDIWALGCIISYMFTGVIPWTNKSKKLLTIQKYITEKVDFPIPTEWLDVSKENQKHLSTILEYCLKNEQNERINAYGVYQLIDALYNDKNFEEVLSTLDNESFI